MIAIASVLLAGVLVIGGGALLVIFGMLVYCGISEFARSLSAQDDKDVIYSSRSFIVYKGGLTSFKCFITAIGVASGLILFITSIVYVGSILPVDTTMFGAQQAELTQSLSNHRQDIYLSILTILLSGISLFLTVRWETRLRPEAKGEIMGISDCK